MKFVSNFLKKFKGKKKVIFVNQFFPPDFAATGQLISELAWELNKKGVSVNILTGMPSYAVSKNKKKPKKKEKKDLLKIYRTNATRLWPRRIRGRAFNGLLFCIRNFIRLSGLTKENNLIIYTTEPPYLPIMGWIIHLFNKTPYMIIIYDLYPNVLINLNVLKENNIIIKIWKMLNSKAFTNSKEIIVLSDAMANTIINQYKNINQKINIIPSWTNTKLIYPIPKKNNEFIAKNHLKNSFVVLYSGNQGRCHDIITILASALLLRDEVDIVFLFIGNGFQNSRIKEIRREWNLKNVKVLPFQELKTLPYSLSSADIALISLGRGSENFVAPSKLYGHLASATPVGVISPENSYLKKIVEEEKFGKWFNNGDIENLAKWIIFLKMSPKIKQEMGLRGRKYINLNASLEIVSNKYYDLIKKNL